MGFFTRTMKGIAEFIGDTEDAITFAEIEKAIINNIEGGAHTPVILSNLFSLLSRLALG